MVFISHISICIGHLFPHEAEWTPLFNHGHGDKFYSVDKNRTRDLHDESLNHCTMGANNCPLMAEVRFRLGPSLGDKHLCKNNIIK